MQGLYDIGSNIITFHDLLTAAVTGTVSGTAVDTQGFNALAYIISVDAVTTLDNSNYLTFTDNVGAASNGSDKAAVQAGSYQYATIGGNGLGNSSAWASPYTIGKGNNSANTDYCIGVSLFDSLNTTVNSGRYHTPTLTATASPSAVLGIHSILATATHQPALGPGTV